MITGEWLGSTDTESIFCDLLAKFAQKGWQSLGDADPHELRGWLEELNQHGTITAVLTDGRDVCVYADRTDSIYIDTYHVGDKGNRLAATRLADELQRLYPATAAPAAAP